MNWTTKNHQRNLMEKKTNSLLWMRCSDPKSLPYSAKTRKTLRCFSKSWTRSASKILVTSSVRIETALLRYMPRLQIQWNDSTTKKRNRRLSTTWPRLLRSHETMISTQVVWLCLRTPHQPSSIRIATYPIAGMKKVSWVRFKKMSRRYFQARSKPQKTLQIPLSIAMVSMRSISHLPSRIGRDWMTQGQITKLIRWEDTLKITLPSKRQLITSCRMPWSNSTNVPRAKPMQTLPMS